MKAKFISILVVVTLVTCLVSVMAPPGAKDVFAAEPVVTEFAICTHTGAQRSPSISDNVIVWMDDRNGNDDIYGYDLSTHTEFPICTNSDGDQNDPSVSGNVVVWMDFRNGNWDIYGYDLSTHAEFPICTDLASQYYPKVSGNVVVWMDTRNGGANIDIYGYDLSTHTEFPICTNSEGARHQWDPSISGNIVVWDDGRNGSYPNYEHDIYGYDLSTHTEFPICTEPQSFQNNPSISGNVVVWRDGRNGNDDIYGYDLSTHTEFPICTNSEGDQDDPSVSGNVVVWWDNRNGNWDIYGYDLSTHAEFPICINLGDQTRPDVSENVFVWDDNRSGNFDIYGATMGGILLGEALDYSAHPVTSGGDAAWFYETSDSCYGDDAARSGTITHGQSTWLSTTATGPCPLIFYWKVSSQSKKDLLTFSIDGKPITSISGSVGWQQYSYVLPQGDHTLQWKYTKNSSISAGSDCGWVDRVTKATVVDYASNPYTDQRFLDYLKSLGITGVLRYIGGPTKSYKVITEKELKALRGAGFAIGLIWQSSKKRINSGSTAGVEDATTALAQADALGFPNSLPIYFVANDWPVSKDAVPTAIVEYFKGIRSVFGSRDIGAYGQCSVLRGLFDNSETEVRYLWQAGASSWSSGQWDSRIQIRQTPEYKKLTYATRKGKKLTCRLDFDDIMSDDWGAWQPNVYAESITETGSSALYTVDPTVRRE